MAKADTVAAIKAANQVELDETQYTQKELDALLASAGDQAAFDALKAQYDGDDQKPDDNLPDDGSVKVSLQGNLYVLESEKDGVRYRIQGDDEKALRAYFKASPEKCVAGQ